jgi:hypothetical protein
LSGKQVTNDLQVANVVESIVPDGTTITTSALTVDGSVESLGNGQSVQRVITAPELFTAKSFSAQRPDPVPEKFRVLSPIKSTEESVAGTAEMPALVAGDLESSEQQVNVHVKRKRKTSRDITSLPKTLTQNATNNVKQLVTIKETLQTGGGITPPSATVDVESQALGDGTYVVRTESVASVFPAQSYGAQKRDNIPEKFQADKETTIQSINKIGTASQPVLASGELERSNEQINQFVYREQVTRRNLPATISMPTVERAYVEGTVVTVDEKLSTSAKIETGLNVSESVATPIGDGKFIVQTVKVKDEWPALKSSEYNYELNAQVERIEQFVAPPENFGEENVQ